MSELGTAPPSELVKVRNGSDKQKRARRGSCFLVFISLGHIIIYSGVKLNGTVLG